MSYTVHHILFFMFVLYLVKIDNDFYGIQYKVKKFPHKTLIFCNIR